MLRYIARSFLYLFFFILSFSILMVLTVILWPSFFDDNSILSLTLYIVQLILSITLSVFLTGRISLKYLKMDVDVSSFGKNDDEIPASIRDRALAMIVDSLIIFVIFFIIAKVVIFFNIKSLLFDKIVLIGIIFFYEPIMVSMFTGTFGHKLFKLKVITLNNKKVPLPYALIRFSVKLFLGIVSFITIIGKKRMAFQDLVTGTKVIYF